MFFNEKQLGLYTEQNMSAGYNNILNTNSSLLEGY